MSDFQYDYKTNCNPIPPWEAMLTTVRAEYFLKVTEKIPRHLEGICFDASGDNMYFCSTDIGRIFRYNFKSGELKELWTDEGVRSFGLKMHRDGRLFACCFPGNGRSSGIVILDSDGNEIKQILKDWPVDDLCFESDGGFYVSKFTGNVWDLSGGIYHMDPDEKTIVPYVEKLASPNGIALSPDESVLWITEYNGGRLLRTPVAGGWGSVPYHYTGSHGPDSCEIDRDGNLYVAMTFQGRIIVHNRDGFPIGQVLMPDREQGKNLISTHATVRPGTRELYISCSDDTYGGSWIMKSEAFAEPL